MLFRSESLWQMLSRKEVVEPRYLITTGQGSFLLEEAARRLSWETIPWWKVIPGARAEHTMTSYCIAMLLSMKLKEVGVKAEENQEINE